jgi:hypothetical protein
MEKFKTYNLFFLALFLEGNRVILAFYKFTSTLGDGNFARELAP